MEIVRYERDCRSFTLYVPHSEELAVCDVLNKYLAYAVLHPDKIPLNSIYPCRTMLNRITMCGCFGVECSLDWLYILHTALCYSVVNIHVIDFGTAQEVRRIAFNLGDQLDALPAIVE